MKIINYTHDDTASELPDYIGTYYRHLYYAPDNVESISTDMENFDDTENEYLYFDIETTGLSAGNSTLYLIGVLWEDRGTIHIRQWFNDDGYSEAMLIASFEEFTSSFTHLVHFNGTTFDVPYIREKAVRHSIDIHNIESLTQIDIYKEIRSYKNLLGLFNVKQVTIENYLGLLREDTYTGGELINVYQRYVARPDEDKEHLLLLHNHDDLMGMPAISNILRYKALFEMPEFTIDNITYNSKEERLKVDLTLADYCCIPKRYIHTDKNGIYINAMNSSAAIIIPAIYEKLKHYFKDYKNYYYLPQEDMAIHKSVAAYVEPGNREKATKANCYIQKEDIYILCPQKDYPELFQKDLKDKILYRSCDSLINNDNAHQIQYIKSLIKIIKFS